MKKSILWDEIIPNFEDFFQMLLDNMIKRHNFNESMKDMIDHVIEEGKAIANLKEKERMSKIIFESAKKGIKVNLNKHYFYTGLKNGLNATLNEERLERLKDIFEEDIYEGKSFSSDLNRRKNKILSEKIAKEKEKDIIADNQKKSSNGNGGNGYNLLLQGLLNLKNQNKVKFTLKLVIIRKIKTIGIIFYRHVLIIFNYYK
jgi:hypothetical protein